VTTTLLLDVDGVLIFTRPGFEAEIERAYPWAEGYPAFERELMSDPAEARSLVGEGDLISLVARILPRHVPGVPAEEFVDRWLGAGILLNDELLDLVPEIAVDEVYLATNQEPVRGTYLAALYADRPWLTGSLMSYELRQRKPDPAYFSAALRRIGRRPDECLLVDDKEACVAGAAEMGIPGIRYHDNVQLAAELTARGLLAGTSPGVRSYGRSHGDRGAERNRPPGG